MADLLKELESEAIHILREVFGQFERPVLMFSGGKDSIVCAHLARKALHPMRLPFPLLHIDTGHNFPEALAHRDRFVREIGADLEVESVQESIDLGEAIEEQGPEASRNGLQTGVLLKAIRRLRADCAIGGGRRDEEKARAKERVFSHRGAEGRWEPRSQRPELWSLYNGRLLPGEHMRAFPISNWTELDVWRYARREGISMPSLYFAHRRRVFDRRGVWLAETPFLSLHPHERAEERTVRFRTIGDATCTGAVLSEAAGIDEVIAEIEASRITERGARHDDRRSETAMEDRKRAGYF
jgi:sulfate adenylyltransferase subunit 2